MEGEDRCCGDHDAAEEPLLEYRPSGWSHAVGIGCLCACAASAFVFVATIEDD